MLAQCAQSLQQTGLVGCQSALAWTRRGFRGVYPTHRVVSGLCRQAVSTQQLAFERGRTSSPTLAS